MDRIKDSGSFDWGSTPHGFTVLMANELVLNLLAFLFVGCCTTIPAGEKCSQFFELCKPLVQTPPGVWSVNGGGISLKNVVKL